MNIFENVKKGLQRAQGLGQQSLPTRDAALQAREIQEASRVTGEQTKQTRTNLAVAQVAKEGEAQRRMLSLEQRQAALELRDQEQDVAEQARLEKAEIDERQLALQEELMQKTQQVLTTFRQDKQRLQNDRERQNIEFAGQMLRLNNETYINKLQTEAAKARIFEEARAKEALAQSIWQQDYAILQSNLDFQRALRADDRKLEEILGNMKIEELLEMAREEADIANEQARWSATSTLVSKGTEMAGKAYIRSQERKEAESNRRVQDVNSTLEN